MRVVCSCPIRAYCQLHLSDAAFSSFKLSFLTTSTYSLKGAVYSLLLNLSESKSDFSCSLIYFRIIASFNFSGQLKPAVLVTNNKLACFLFRAHCVFQAKTASILNSRFIKADRSRTRNSGSSRRSHSSN